MEPQQQALITNLKVAMQSLIDSWRTLQASDREFRNAVYQVTGSHPLSAPADMDTAMAPIIDHFHKLLAQLSALGL